MRARLMLAGSLISLLVLISGCAEDQSQPSEPALNGPELTDPDYEKSLQCLSCHDPHRPVKK